MRSIERILLYAMSGAMAWVLLVELPALTKRHQDQVSEDHQIPPLQPGTLPGVMPRDPAVPAKSAIPGSAVATPAISANAAGGMGSMEKLEIVDSSGKIRIRLWIDDAGVASILLNDSAGNEAIRLAAGRTEHSLEIVRNNRSARLNLQDNGASIQVRSGKSDGFEALVDAAGNSRVTLTHARGSRSELRASADGITGLQVTGPAGEVSAGLTSDNAAELTASSAKGLQTAFVRVFDDGAGEIAVRPNDSKAGPGLLLLPEGASVVSIQSANGNPVAGLVGSESGDAVISVGGSDQSATVEMRVSTEKTADLLISDSAGSVSVRSTLETIQRNLPNPKKPQAPQAQTTALAR